MPRWKFPEGVLHQGDCLEVMAALPPDSADLVVCSPPYEDARLYLEGGEDLGISMNTEDWVAWMVKVIQ
jgi:DNA modification methylase